MTVPGQVHASNEHFLGIHGMPTEQEIAKVVKALPKAVNGKHMSELLSPCMEAGHVIKFSIEHGKWKFFQITDTYSVQDTTTGEAYAGGIHVKEFTKLLKENRIVVYDGQDQPIALAVQDLKNAHYSKTYNIYATTQIYETDKAVEIEDGIAFYPWFQVHDYDEFHADLRTFRAWNGARYEPLYRVEPVLSNKSNNVVVDNNDPTIQYAMVSKHTEGKIAGWHVCVAPGADPLAFLTLAAVLDTMVGWFK